MFLPLHQQLQYWKLASDISGNVDSDPVSGTHAFLPGVVICPSPNCIASLLCWHGGDPSVCIGGWRVAAAVQYTAAGCCLETLQLWGVVISHSLQGAVKQMKQARGSPSKTGCVESIITHLETNGCSHSLSKGIVLWEKKKKGRKKSSFAANASRCNVIMNTTVSHLRSTPTVGFLLFKPVSEMIYLWWSISWVS